MSALALALGGCATQSAVFHSLPPEHPAASNAADIARANTIAAEAGLAAKSTAGAAHGGPDAKQSESPPLLTPAYAPPLSTYDPWAHLNRFTYRFNARFDEAIFLPVANGYRRLPAPLRSGVHNFFGNLGEVDSLINYTLQGRLGRGVRSLGRFVINSTIGIGGLVDVAETLHLPKAPTGFGTTLAKWGMHPGPYLVIPFYGPSSLREGIGLAADYGTSYGINLADLYRSWQSWGLGVTNAVDQRASIDFRYYASGSPFEYETIRFLSVRKQLIEDAGLHRKRLPPKPNPNQPAGE
ncbi:MAG TPA: VacJ family lipoprotein [Steroidobacteraceae bacterium]|nr:VacJ family lipoprotein [Steroidobacteraceae bacterium]